MSMTRVSFTSSHRLRYLLPVTAFIALALTLGWALMHNPRELPSALIGKQVPEFNLSPVKGRTFGLSSADLRGEISLVNVFASWCVACREEHPLFMRMKAEGLLPIYGLNYKDAPDNAATWLNTLAILIPGPALISRAAWVSTGVCMAFQRHL